MSAMMKTPPVRMGWNRGPVVRFRPISELRSFLVGLGFGVDEDEVAAGRPRTRDRGN